MGNMGVSYGKDDIITQHRSAYNKHWTSVRMTHTGFITWALLCQSWASYRRLLSVMLKPRYSIHSSQHAMER